MISRLLALATVAALTFVHAQTPQQPPASGQTFRTGTEVVLVDVAVRDGGRAVPGLAAADFVLTDNGVRQRVDSVAAASVPIDLTLVLDLSGDTSGSWTKARPAAKVREEIDRQLRAATALLRPEDRVRLLTLDQHITEAIPLQPVGEGFRLPPLEHGGLPALHDGLVAALLQPSEPARRHVVIANTKGLDTFSSVGGGAVRAIAERADALFHVALLEEALDNEAALRQFQCQMMGLCWPTRTFWVPFERRLVGPRAMNHVLFPDGVAVAAGAEATGGALHKTAIIKVPTVASVLRKTMEDFRSSYVLRYAPQGVAGAGWHSIEVRVPGKRGYQVRARRGYFVESAPAPTAATPAVPTALRTLADFTRAYEAGAFDQVSASMRQVTDPVRLLREFEEGGNPWPAVPKREAAFALELVEPVLFSDKEATRQAAEEFLGKFARLVRHPLEGDSFERYWHFTLLTLMEGTTRAAVTESFAQRALARFPDEPRFMLSLAIATDQRWTGGSPPARIANGTPLGEHVALVERRYTAALKVRETEAEARIRLAWLLHRIGRREEALAHLTAVGRMPLTDMPLRYLQPLLLGHVLQAAGRREESLAAFRQAAEIMPSGQSAQVALMNSLLIEGRRSEAEAIAERVQTAVLTEMDPWWMYWQGQYRFHAAAAARLRGLIQ